MTEALEKSSIQFVTLFDTRPYHFMGKVIEAGRKKFELVTIVTDRASHNTTREQEQFAKKKVDVFFCF